MQVNGEAVQPVVKDGYAVVERTWKKGDRLHVELPMHLYTMGLPDGSANYSFLYGPVVLGASLGKQQQDGMYADDSRGGHIAAGPRWPLHDMPVIVGDREHILSHVTKAEGKPLTFTLTGIHAKHVKELTLQPFFRLHECRYMVYFPVITPQELAARMEQLAKEEKERIALDAITADKVTCGEQQPESDHFIQMEQASAGDDEGVHWRETRAWFSYRMKTAGKKVAQVRIAFRPELRRDAFVYINDVKVGTLDDKQRVALIPVPQDLQTAEVLTVKIAKGDMRVTPHIYEVRLTE